MKVTSTGPPVPLLPAVTFANDNGYHAPMAPTPSQLSSVTTCDRLSVVGVAKNCGKTTTLTSLLRIRDSGLASPSLLSIGVDGETEDALLGTDKPPIHVRRNQWIVTADSALRNSTARVEYVEPLGLTTPIGDVYVCRVLEPGTIKLAGLRQHADVVRAVDVLERLGPGPVWIDGAYGRLTSAHPDVTDAVVVATGAVAGSTVTDVVGETVHLVSRLSAPTAESRSHRDLIDQAIGRRRLLLLDEDGDAIELPVRSAVAGLDELRDHWDDNIEAVAIPGLISDRVVEQLLAFDDATLLVPDPTVLQMKSSLWSTFRNRWTIRVLHAVEPVGVSYNPTSVDGNGFDATTLKSALEQRLTEPFIFDPLPCCSLSI